LLPTPTPTEAAHAQAEALGFDPAAVYVQHPIQDRSDEELRALADALPKIMDRFDKLTPPPRGPLPILIGGSGPKVTLRLTAQHADAWNSFGPPASYAEKSRTLDEWCARVERNPRQVERTLRHEVAHHLGYNEPGVAALGL